jgi:transaldolase
VLFLDSSDPKEIRDISAWGAIAGITTNPLILARETGGADLETTIRTILELSTGHVSVELTSESEREMLEEALAYHGFNPERVCIKVPFGEVGLRVHHQLAQRGMATNVTCIMSFPQAYIAALAGATYVSVFSGRIRDMGYDAASVIRDTRAAIDREGLTSKIIVGSIRHAMDVSEAIQAGAHIVTVPPPILRKMLWNPRTESTIAEFNDAWKDRGKR